MTIINPGVTRRAKERPPLVLARIILLTVLVESPTRIGTTASAAFIFSDATSEATEIVAECVSTKPANAAATIMPVSPNHSRSAAALCFSFSLLLHSPDRNDGPIDDCRQAGEDQ
jgi:hypothetical protein